MCQDRERAPAGEGTDPAVATWQSHTGRRTWELVTGGGMRGTVGIPAYTRALMPCER